MDKAIQLNADSQGLECSHERLSEGSDPSGMGTSIKAWDAKTPGCANCMAQASLYGSVHSSDPMGTFEKRDALGAGGKAGNAAAVLMGGSVAKHKAYAFHGRPGRVREECAIVAAQANDLLLSELAKEK